MLAPGTCPDGTSGRVESRSGTGFTVDFACSFLWFPA